MKMCGLNVAVVGCGFVANDHLSAWKKTKLGRVMAICDLNEALAKRMAEIWRIPKYYTSISDLIENNHLDVIDICTPPQTHASQAVQAMKAGFHVLLEKPMTMTVKDAEGIVKCEETSGMKAGVVHNWLFEPPIIRATKMVGEKRIDEVISLDIEVLSTKYDSMAMNQNHWCHKLPGGRFSEMLAHPIYLCRHFLGDEIEVLDVNVSKVGDYAWMKSDELCATFHVGNKFGRVYASFNSPRDAILLRLYGRTAILELDIINATIAVLSRRERKRLRKGLDSFSHAAQLIKSTLGNMARVSVGKWSSGHETCIRLFAKGLLSDDKLPVSAEDGLITIKSLEQMCKRIEDEERHDQTNY